MSLPSQGRLYLKPVGTVCKWPRSLWLSVFIFVVCGSYAWYFIVETPSSTAADTTSSNAVSDMEQISQANISSSTWIKRTRSIAHVHAVHRNNEGSFVEFGAVGSSPALRPTAQLNHTSMVAGVRAELYVLMHSRLQQARAYRARMHSEMKAARHYLRDPHEHGRFLTSRPPHGGIGNFMFTFATLLGSARENNRIPVRISNEPRMVWFEGMDLEFIEPSVLFPNGTIDKHTIGELGSGIFTPRFHEINAFFPTKAVAIFGYGQSWKYFHKISAEVRSMFTLTEPTQSTAIRVITDGITRVCNATFLSCESSVPVLVGIHVRRGDIIAKEDQSRFGHIPATEGYLLRAALHVQTKYQNALFFVISEDQDYCRTVFREKHFVITGPNTQEVDMAIMTFMEVMVLSVGSFGWWGAYLGGAKEVFYSKDWPKPGSQFAKGIAPEDYFFPYWQGLD